MDEINVPYHLVIPTVICMVGLWAIMFFRQRLFLRNQWLWTSVTVFFVIYLFIVGSSIYHDIYYQSDLNRYDLDKDGFFGGQEITKEQEAAMQRLTNDVGRNSSLITGFIFAGAISTTVYLFGRLKSPITK